MTTPIDGRAPADEDQGAACGTGSRDEELARLSAAATPGGSPRKHKRVTSAGLDKLNKLAGLLEEAWLPTWHLQAAEIVRAVVVDLRNFHDEALAPAPAPAEGAQSGDGLTKLLTAAYDAGFNASGASYVATREKDLARLDRQSPPRASEG